MKTKSEIIAYFKDSADGMTPPQSLTLEGLDGLTSIVRGTITHALFSVWVSRLKSADMRRFQVLLSSAEGEARAQKSAAYHEKDRHKKSCLYLYYDGQMETITKAKAALAYIARNAAESPLDSATFLGEVSAIIEKYEQ